MSTAEPLFDCPFCGRKNFGERGLRAHRCQARGGKPLSLPAIHMIKRGRGAVLAPAPATETPSMSKTAKHALTLVADPAFAVKGNELSRLQQAAIEQMKLVAQLQTEAAVRAILVGTALHRIKASMKHGTFMPWCAQHITVGKSQVNNYMRLASVFLEKSKVAKPDLLALPGDQLSLETESATAKRFMDKLAGFCGDHSLTELLIKHGIKAVGLKTELEQGGDPTPAAGAAEDYFAEVAERVYGFRQLVTSRENLARLTPQQLETLHQTVTDSYSEFRRLYEEARGRSQQA